VPTESARRVSVARRALRVEIALPAVRRQLMSHFSGAFVVLSAVLTVAAPAPKDDPMDYQKKADEAAWDWNADQASLDYAVKKCPLAVEVQKKDFGRATITVKLDEKTSFTFEGHTGTVFVVKDKVLYYADFSPVASGCVVIARDLENDKQLWKAPLKGLGPITHTRYSNAVTLDLDGEAVRVVSKEAAGRYIEYVDRKEGKTVGHKVFKDK
jgi:hypothetical protein